MQNTDRLRMFAFYLFYCIYYYGNIKKQSKHWLCQSLPIQSMNKLMASNTEMTSLETVLQTLFNSSEHMIPKCIYVICN